MYILLALLIFSVLIFIHELGHFLVARACGVEILEFAIGMGPKILSWKSKRSGTRYSIRLFPIGGYVNMLGENGMEAVQGDASGESKDDASGLINTVDADGAPETIDPERAKHAYCNQSVWKRILISLAGPLMNVLLGFVLMLVLVLAQGSDSMLSTKIGGFFVEYSAEESVLGFEKGDYLYGVNGERVYSLSDFREVAAEQAAVDVYVQRLNAEETAYEIVKLEGVSLSDEFIVDSFTASLSEQSGVQQEDVVLRVNSTRVHTYDEMRYEIMNQGYQPVRLTVLREGETVVLEDVIFPSTVESGVTFGMVDFIVYREDFNFGTVLKHTWFRSVSTVKMVFDSLGGLFSGRYGVEAVSGPVGITKTISDVAQTGILSVIYLVTVISINLGVMNLLPFPALDGGHLLIYVIEIVRRKPMKKETEGLINFVGLIILLALIVLITVKDIIAL